MKRTDGRKIDHATLEWIRITAVRRVVKGKESPEDVIQGFKLDRTNIYRWLRRYREGGWQALKSTKATGPKPKLTQRQQRQLTKLLMKNPQQLHFDFGLWNLEMAQELINKRFKKQLSIWTVSRILRAMGYTRQKPLYRAYQQDPERIRRWMHEEYPVIAAEAKRERRTIFFEDEAGFTSTSHRGSTWAKQGQTPIVKSSGARYRINCMSAVTKRGDLRFMLYEGSGNSDRFITFLRHLAGTVGTRKLTMIVDGHSMHKTKKVADFIQQSRGKLKLSFLPPYAPELNPDEQVWNHSKRRVQRTMIGGKMGFVSMIRSSLHAIQKSPRLVQSFFLHPDVAYLR